MQTERDTILLVEDDEADIELASHIIKEKVPSLRLVVSRNGSEALDFLFPTTRNREDTYAKNLRLILLDLHMPGIDGYDVLRRVKSSDQRKHIPVTVLTSSQEVKDIQFCYALGVNSYVVKPINIEQYEQVIKGIVFYWLNINETATTHLSLPLTHL